MANVDDSDIRFIPIEVDGKFLCAYCTIVRSGEPQFFGRTTYYSHHRGDCSPQGAAWTLRDEADAHEAWRKQFARGSPTRVRDSERIGVPWRKRRHNKLETSFSPYDVDGDGEEMNLSWTQPPLANSPNRVYEDPSDVQGLVLNMIMRGLTDTEQACGCETWDMGAQPSSSSEEEPHERPTGAWKPYRPFRHDEVSVISRTADTERVFGETCSLCVRCDWSSYETHLILFLKIPRRQGLHASRGSGYIVLPTSRP